MAGTDSLAKLCGARLGISAEHVTSCVLDPHDEGEHDNGLGIRWGGDVATVYLDVHMPGDPLDNW